MMEITVTAPNRIDLAGGTTDLYPLYLFMDGGFTVNVAVDIASRVHIKTGHIRGIRLVSEDLGHTLESKSVAELPTDGPLSLVARSIRALAKTNSLEVTTRNFAPAGSGLGASSSLLIALTCGLMELENRHSTPKQTIDYAVNIEAANLGVPAGSQDHIAAFFGGVSCLEFGYQSFSRRTISNPQKLNQLQEMLLVSYTGEARFSGMNNWEVTKAFIEDGNGVRAKLIAIRDIARNMGEVILSGAMDGLPELVNEEWRIRKTLADGISTERIETIMQAAESAGARAGKICGAGGGGCMVSLVPPGRRQDVEEAITKAGGSVLPCRIARNGVTVTKKDG